MRSWQTIFSHRSIDRIMRVLLCLLFDVVYQSPFTHSDRANCMLDLTLIVVCSFFKQCFIWFTNTFFSHFCTSIVCLHVWCIFVVYLWLAHALRCAGVCTLHAYRSGRSVGCFPVFCVSLPWDKVSCWIRSIPLTGLGSRALKASLHPYPLMLGLLTCRDMCDFLHGFKDFKFRFSYLPHKPAYPLNHVAV